VFHKSKNPTLLFQGVLESTNNFKNLLFTLSKFQETPKTQMLKLHKSKDPNAKLHMQHNFTRLTVKWAPFGLGRKPIKKIREFSRDRNTYCGLEIPRT